MAVITSDSFDIFPVCKQDVIFRTFDNLIGFSNKYKKAKMCKAIKEEFINGKNIDDRILKQQAIERAEALKAKVKTKRNLDEKPLRIVVPKDTEYSVEEMAKFAYENSLKAHGRWDSAQDLERSLKGNAGLRKQINGYMIKKLGHKNKLETKKEPAKKEAPLDIFNIANRALKSKNPAVKALIGDIKKPEVLRRMMEKDANSTKKLATLLKNINE